ncbi:hypothetical protein KIMH_14590 [Bombiscardovia apis]|uniref:Uncharacterized protein n=1 Tax=Bombiscardovia apis TaxID=2932182 RepID=A0ABN6SJR5_9BIFI|nr:hypothetical protein KIMH_14590 [Bombiscardovia apis]
MVGTVERHLSGSTGHALSHAGRVTSAPVDHYFARCGPGGILAAERHTHRLREPQKQGGHGHYGWQNNGELGGYCARI